MYLPMHESMKVIITLTPFSVSAVCRKGRRVAASNIQLIITSGIMNKMKEIRHWTITTSGLFLVMDTSDVS